MEGSRGANGLVEGTLEAFSSERRALHVRDGADVPPHLLSLSRRDRFLSLAPELLHALGVLSQVQSGADQDDRHTGRVVVQLWEPLRKARLRTAQSQLPARSRAQLGALRARARKKHLFLDALERVRMA